MFAQLIPPLLWAPEAEAALLVLLLSASLSAATPIPTGTVHGEFREGWQSGAVAFAGGGVGARNLLWRGPGRGGRLCFGAGSMLKGWAVVVVMVVRSRGRRRKRGRLRRVDIALIVEGGGLPLLLLVGNGGWEKGARADGYVLDWNGLEWDRMGTRARPMRRIKRSPPPPLLRKVAPTTRERLIIQPTCRAAVTCRPRQPSEAEPFPTFCQHQNQKKRKPTLF